MRCSGDRFAFITIECASARDLCYLTSTWASARYLRMSLRRLDRTASLIGVLLTRRHSVPLNGVVDRPHEHLQVTLRRAENCVQAPSRACEVAEWTRCRTRVTLGRTRRELLDTSNELTNLIYGEALLMTDARC